RDSDQFDPAVDSASRFVRHWLRRRVRCNHFRNRLRDLVRRASRFESSQRCHRSTERARSCRYRWNSLARRADHIALHHRFHRRSRGNSHGDHRKATGVTKRLRWIDISKALAIIFVVYFHFLRTIFERYELPPNDWSNLAASTMSILRSAWWEIS